MEWLEYIYYKISTLVSGFMDTISYVWSFLTSAWYSLTTILTGLYDMISQIFSSGIF